MTTFDVRTYWPQPAPGVVLTNTFDAGIVNEYHRIIDGFILRQTINGVWDSDWYYRIDPDRGVLEYRDDYPKKWYSTPWLPTRQVWCVPGKEIFWGFQQKFGEAMGSQCVTSGLFGQYGWQELAFYEILQDYATPAGTLKNVLVMEYWQTWSDQPPVGAKMWMAPGLGTIRAEWTRNYAPTGYSMTLQKTSIWTIWLATLQKTDG
jgi:hypothetical protein